MESQSQYLLKNIQLIVKTEDGYHCASVALANRTYLAQLHNKGAADYQQSLPVEMSHGFED